MVKKNLKLALRSLVKHKSFSFINILGLSVGMTIGIVMLMWGQYELTYDSHHTNKEQIFRIQRQYMSQDGGLNNPFCSIAPSLIPILEQEIDAFENITRMFTWGNYSVAVEDRNYMEKNVFYAEPDVFEVFDIPMKIGSPTEALKQNNSIVLSSSLAEKLFPNSDALGKEVEVNETRLMVTGIMEDTPKQSHFDLNCLISYSVLRDPSVPLADDTFLGSKNFNANYTYSYAKLKPGANIEEVEQLIAGALDSRIAPMVDNEGKETKASERYFMRFVNLGDIHLQSHTQNELGQNGSMQYVRLFVGTAFFVMLIACFNFVNLATARALKRTKEIGIKKIVGASRGVLVGQLFLETAIIATVSLIIAIVAIRSFMAGLNSQLGLNLQLDQNTIGILIAILLACVFLSGVYPSLYISNFKPTAIFGGARRKNRQKLRLRNLLVIFQFAISAILITSIVMMKSQMTFLLNFDLGFKADNNIVLPYSGQIGEQWASVKSKLKENPYVSTVTRSKNVPTDYLRDAPGYQAMVHGELKDTPFQIPHYRTGYDFLKAYDFQILAGRGFSEEIQTDLNQAYILNEKAVRMLGWDDINDAIGAEFQPNFRDRGIIIGVVNDAHFEPLTLEVVPLMIYLAPQEANTITVQLSKGADKPATIEYITATINDFVPGIPLEYTFFEDKVRNVYQSESRMTKLFFYFSSLAIFIACLGLYGLTSHEVAYALKQIGIRKVLGASVSRIILLFSNKVVLWILIGNIVALPLAYYGLNNWLDTFAYSINIGVVPFLITGIATMLLGLAVASVHISKAALSNPVKALRHE